MNAGIVEEVKIPRRLLAAVRPGQHRAAGDAGFVQFVVGFDGQQVPSGAQEGRHLRHHGQKAPFVLHRQHAVHIHLAAVSHTAETNKVPLAWPDLLGEHVGFIPEIAAVIPLPGFGEHVGKAGGHGHGNGRGQAPFRPALLVARFLRVELEAPEAVQQLGLADLVADGI